MLLEMPAPIYLSSAALAVAALAWLKWPRITTRFYQERHSRDFRLWEVALMTSPPPASPVTPARKARRFEIAVYLSIKRCK
ncbi:MAG: hypothetical protein JWN71_3434 [Xanthobacteraceae bacterium]|jgi:hypothetical protein|nr:hypothetical protein [Xanthobacteraceae bacterium]